MLNQITYYVLFIVFMLNTNHLFANNFQNEKQIDSLLNASIRDIYDNPNASIKLGLSIYDNETTSLKTKIKALRLVATAYTSKRDYQKALEYTIITEEFSNQLNDPVLNIELLLKIGNLYQQLKIFDKSIKYLDQAEQLCLSFHEKDSVRFFLGNIYLVKGFIYKDNLNCDIALSFFDKGISEYKKMEGSAIKNNLSIALYNKGNCYTLLSEYEDAKISFHRAISYAKSQNANSLISFAQKGLAEVYTLEGRYQEALNLLQIALKQSKNVGDIILNLGIYKGLFENYLAINNWEEYQKYYTLYLKTQTEIKKSERNSISDSISENSKVNIEKHQAIETSYHNYVKYIVVILILISTGIIFIKIKNKKTILLLQEKIKILQNVKAKTANPKTI